MLAALLLVFAPSVTGAQEGAPQTPVFSSTVALTRVKVAVVDREGRPVRDLVRGDFILRHDGRERPIEVLLAPEDVPLDLVLLPDFSPSVAEGWPDARERIIEFLDALDPVDRVYLLPFNSQVGPGVREAAPHPALRALVEGFPMAGRTRLYDALFAGYSSFEQLAQAGERRRAIVLLTDGADAGSGYSYRDVLMQAWRGGVPLFPVAVGTAAIPRRDLDGFRTLGVPRAEIEAVIRTQEQLEELARVSGGRAVSEREIRDGYQRVLALLRGYYVLGYRAPGGDERGWQEVQVRLRDPGDRRVLAQPGTYGGDGDPGAALRAIEEGERLLSERRFAEALQAFAVARSGELEIGFPDLGAGLAHEGLGQLDAAEAAYRRELARNPGASPAHGRLAVLGFRRGDSGAAWEHALRAVAGGEDLDRLIDDLVRRHGEPVDLDLRLRRPVLFLVRPEEPGLEEQRILEEVLRAIGQAVERRHDVVLTRNAAAASHYLRLDLDRVRIDDVRADLELWSVREAKRLDDVDLRLDAPLEVDRSRMLLGEPLEELLRRLPPRR